MVVWSSAAKAIAQPGLANILSKPGVLQSFFKNGKLFYVIQLIHSVTLYCQEVTLVMQSIVSQFGYYLEYFEFFSIENCLFERYDMIRTINFFNQFLFQLQFKRDKCPVMNALCT